MPLTYERAYGGLDYTGKKVDARNMVGVGVNRLRIRGIAGTPLPNLEAPGFRLRRPTIKMKPIGLGFVGRSWQPRASYAGTYNQEWIENRYPFLPLDFDERYYQGAPEDQTCVFLRGGEHVRLTNLTPEGVLEFTLPELSVPVKLVYKRGPEHLTTVLDTVIIEPNALRCILVWRGSAPLRGKLVSLREVWLGHPSRGRLRALEKGKRYLVWQDGTAHPTG
jgi:hypothetical protein